MLPPLNDAGGETWKQHSRYISMCACAVTDRSQSVGDMWGAGDKLAYQRPGVSPKWGPEPSPHSHHELSTQAILAKDDKIAWSFLGIGS